MCVSLSKLILFSIVAVTALISGTASANAHALTNLEPIQAEYTRNSNRYIPFEINGNYSGEEIEDHPMGNLMGPVPYFDKEQRLEFQILPLNGKFYFLNGLKVGQSEEVTGLIVMDPAGRIYFAYEAMRLSSKISANHLHHSSFLAGRPVAFAGHARILNGDILWINNESGHYLPPTSSIKQILTELVRQKASLPLSIMTYRIDKTYDAHEPDNFSEEEIKEYANLPLEFPEFYLSQPINTETLCESKLVGFGRL